MTGSGFDVTLSVGHTPNPPYTVGMGGWHPAPPGCAQNPMPILKWFPSQGSPKNFVLLKPVSTIGRALGNDVAVPNAGLSETHAQVLFDGRDFNLEEVDKQGEILVNGQKKRRARP